RDRARAAWAGCEALGEEADALHPGRVVDRAGAAPDRVVVGGDDDRLVALAGQDGDDVALGAAWDEAAADPDARRRSLQLEQPLRVGARDERGRADDDLARAGDEGDRVAAERAH